MTAAQRTSITRIARGLLGALFCWAAISKLANPPQFFGELLGYQLPLPEGALRSVAIVLPWLELLCGLMLWTGYQLRAALGWCLVLFAIFAVATGQAWARGLNISCGCFDLNALGLDSMLALAKFLDSVAFAFFRSLLFFAVTIWIWRSSSFELVAVDKSS